MVLQILVMMVDGARTTFFSILAITINIYALKQHKIKLSRKFVAYGTFIIGILLVIFARAIIMKGDNNGINSIIIEGEAGSYMVLQSIYGYTNKLISNYTWGLSYIVDPLIYIFTKGDIRENLLFFNQWSNSLAFYLSDNFAPMGGFYYIAEGLAFLPIIGPLISTAMFAFITIYIENNKNKHRIIYIVYIATIGVLFSKQLFSNLFTIFITVLIFFLILLLLFKILRAVLYKTVDKVKK
jgi:hypothetical protein